jgi:hypothetical protein
MQATLTGTLNKARITNGRSTERVLVKTLFYELIHDDWFPLAFACAVALPSPPQSRVPFQTAGRNRPDTVGEFAGLAESSTYAGKSARIVASIRTETGSLSFLAQP